MALFMFAGGQSFLHRADPRSKILAIFIVLWIAITTSQPLIMAVTLGLVVAALRLLAAIPLRTLGLLVLAFSPLIIVVTLLQALIRAPGPEDFSLAFGPLQLSGNGMLAGWSIGMRLATMGLAFAGYAMTTRPTDIALAMTKGGIPYRYSYLVSFALRFFPLVQDEALGLLTVSEVRGSPDPSSKNPFRRARAVFRILLPLMIGTLRRSMDIALAMELRGYREGGERTYLRKIGFGREDAFLLLGMVGMLVLTLSLRSVVR